MHYIPIPCQYCDEAPCISACPIKGVIYRRDDGLIIIDPEKCTGCKVCIDACHYDAIFMNEDLNIAQKCTGCVHLLDSGEWTIFSCVDACPTEDIKFGEESEFKALIAKVQVLKPELGYKPRVYYLNIPRNFIAGTVHDPIAKEVIIGATCTLSSDGKKLTVTTDGFGDFWFEGLEVGACSLSVEATGFTTKKFDNLNTEKDVNLGDISLEK